ncbi:MAG: hypothetical protein RRY36_09845 [Bacteroidaceae bacterium]
MGNNEHQKTENKKQCFIITPIGNPDSEIRKKADGVINAIIKPILSELGYDTVPPHEMSKSGSITQQVIEHIVNDELVIVNLTGLNANVMYELAIRHCVKKPVVCIIERNTQLPFDVATERFIMYDDNFSNVISLKDNIKRTIISSIKEGEIDNPIYKSMKNIDIMKKISESNDPNSNVLKLIVNRLGKIEKNINTRSVDSLINEYNEDFCAIIKLGENNIDSQILNKIISMIANEFVSNHITVAIIYDKDKNEITVSNGNFHMEVLEILIFNFTVELGLKDVKYELYPF